MLADAGGVAGVYEWFIANWVIQMQRSTDEKINTVITQNTFWFSNKAFEEGYEAYLTTLKETLLVLRNQVQTEGLTKKLIEELIAEKENGLKVLLALTGLSNEFLKRLITFIRVVDDKELSKLSYRAQWLKDAELNGSDIKEWSDSKIAANIRASEAFRKGIVNLFYEGSTVPVLCKTLPLFELKKLSLSKLSFEAEAMIDTLIRYKEKGSYSGKRENNPETVIASLLNEMETDFVNGDLDKLKEHAAAQKRRMDFIIPNQEDPQVIIESSYLATTSSAQGDKSKTERTMKDLIKTHYPEARFWGFVDGIGWYVRRTDLRRMVDAYEEVFTFSEAEIRRFCKSLTAILE